MKISWKTKTIKFMFHNRFRIKTNNLKHKKNFVEHTKFTHINVFFT